MANIMRQMKKRFNIHKNPGPKTWVFLCLLIPGRTIDNQQIYISIVLEITFDAIVAECEPGYFFDQGPNGLVCEIHHTILGRLTPNARIVDSIQTALAQLTLDFGCINRVLRSSYLHMSIAPVGVGHAIHIAIVTRQATRLHIPSWFLNQILSIVSVDFQPHKFKAVQVDNTNIVLAPIQTLFTAQKAVFLC